MTIRPFQATLVLVIFGTLLSVCHGFLPFQNPPWPATYNMTLSTMCMAANVSGWLDLGRASQWGIISIDWANARLVWAQQQPMDCEERLLQQAEAIKASNAFTKVFVYRNAVKGLNWFSSIRSILADPQYSGFFLRFSGAPRSDPQEAPVGPFHVPPCTTQLNSTLCSGLYHDQEQTPEFVSASNPQPSIPCLQPCDCGTLPCGEYLFDYRNGSQLTDWLLENYYLSTTALGSPSVSGLFIDDFWCSLDTNSSGQCNDPVPGPSEIDMYSQLDMGLSDDDVYAITVGWLESMSIVQRAILSRGGYTWSLIPGQSNANAMPLLLNSSNCLPLLRNASNNHQFYHSAPLLAGLTYNSTLGSFPWLEEQLAGFLLMRGPYAYIGWGQWGMMWPPEVPLPSTVWSVDPGVPLEDGCREVGEGIFSRQWSKVNVSLDCHSFSASFQFL